MDQIERFDPLKSRGRIAYEHLHRYALCRAQVAGKHVLDLACGTGYGTRLLADTAQSVVGVDISEEAIATAKTVHQRDNLEFQTADCFSLPFEAERFDAVVANEMIEHVPDHAALLAEARRVLRNDGILLISTPNKAVYNRYQAPNPFHVSEVSTDDFAAELSAHFRNVRLVGTRMALVSMSEDLAVGGRRKAGKIDVHLGSYADDGQPAIGAATLRVGDPEYVLAMCSDGAINAAPFGNSIYFNPEDNLWIEHEKVIAWASHLHLDYQDLYETLVKRSEELSDCRQKLLEIEQENFRFRKIINDLQSRNDT